MADLELQRVQWENLGIGEERSIYHVQSCTQTPGGYLGGKEWPRAIGCLIVSDGNEDQDGLQDAGDESMNIVASRVCGFSWCSQNSRTLSSLLPVFYGNQGRKGINRNNKTWLPFHSCWLSLALFIHQFMEQISIWGQLNLNARFNTAVRQKSVSSPMEPSEYLQKIDFIHSTNKYL